MTDWLTLCHTHTIRMRAGVDETFISFLLPLIYHLCLLLTTPLFTCVDFRMSDLFQSVHADFVPEERWNEWTSDWGELQLTEVNWLMIDSLVWPKSNRHVMLCVYYVVITSTTLCFFLSLVIKRYIQQHKEVHIVVSLIAQIRINQTREVVCKFGLYHK